MMDKNTMWKWLILALLLFFSLWAVTPPKEKIRLGLDLKGGTAFQLKIDEEKLRADLAANPELSEEEREKRYKESMHNIDGRTLEILRSRIDSLGINEPIVESGANHTILLQLPGTDEEQRRKARDSIKSAALLEFRLVHPKNDELVARLYQQLKAPPGYEIERIGTRTVYVKIAAEEFEKIDRNDAYLRELGRFEAPSVMYEFMLQREIESGTGEEFYRPAYVKRSSEMTGEKIKEAGVTYNSFQQPWVKIAFNARGAIEFAKLTKKYAADDKVGKEGRQLAIVLDGVLKSAPVLRTPITDGVAIIEGQFSDAEVDQLVNVLTAGALPARVNIESERFVSPSLGEDARKSGVWAIVVGGAAVLLFMFVYYAYCGFVANLALLLDMLLLPIGMLVAGGLLGLFGGTSSSSGGVGSLPVLTLPGIAGILLTIGMAVDANVLIFERIREESRSGKHLLAAIHAGYDRAFVTIVDANITTLLTAVVLFVFGSGPIRGFAVTLSACILVSMITALVFTRLVFDLTIKEGRQKAFKMLSIIKANTTIDFIGKRKAAAIFSLVVIVVTWGILSYRGVTTPEKVFGVDFTGGTALVLSFDQDARADMDDVRAALDASGIQGCQPQYQQEMDGDEFLRVKCGAEHATVERDGEQVEVAASVAIGEALQKALPDSKWEFRDEERVSAQVGQAMKWDAVKAIVIALIVIVLYVSIRFEFGFALGAIAALAHDVLFTTGVYCLSGRQISLPIIAALLTIVGYSVNDTIVVFDRIREDLRLNKKLTFLEICNLSINQTLSRTLLTSLTTLVAVLSLVILGGGAIFDFSLTLLIGIIVGTYSSIFVATPAVLLFYRFKKPGFATKT